MKSEYKNNYGGVEEDDSMGAILGFFLVVMALMMLFIYICR